ncbi:MAG: ARMT1-like domain-containing protein [Phycisphaeraceae bacterium]
MSQTSADTTLPQLADVDNYRACTWNLAVEPDKRRYWVGLFRWHFPKLLEEAGRDALDRGADVDDVAQRGERARVMFEAFLDELLREADRYDWFDIYMIGLERERVLREVGIDDPYRLAKSRENETALAVLPRLLAELDAMPPAGRDEAVARGVFAGNIFDLGATKTVERFRDQRVDFHATLDELKARPWLVDDYDAWIDRLRGPAHRAALLFVDNAGPDIVLGMLPLARELVRRGSRVLLAANTDPSLNDITHVELVGLLDRVGKIDPVLRDAWASGQLQALADGNGAPLIDLTRLDPAFVEAVSREPIDLVVLEGMGRALESNFNARLSCEALKVAMIKDPGVAEALGGELYDLVLRYERPG